MTRPRNVAAQKRVHNATVEGKAGRAGLPLLAPREGLWTVIDGFNVWKTPDNLLHWDFRADSRDSSGKKITVGCEMNVEPDCLEEN